MHTDIHNTHLLHRTAAQLGKHPNAITRIQNIYENENLFGSTDVTYTSVTNTYGDLNPLPMVTIMPTELFIIIVVIIIIITSLCTFNCVLHKGQVHTIRPGGCCLLALVQGSSNATS
jgi:hypothetical protein